MLFCVLARNFNFGTMWGVKLPLSVSFSYFYSTSVSKTRVWAESKPFEVHLSRVV